MTPAETTRHFLVAQIANAQRTGEHAQQLLTDARLQVQAAERASTATPNPLPELRAATDLATAQARLAAHDQAQAALQL